MKITKKKVKNKEYYYIEHSYRIDNEIKKSSKYIGKNIPKNIEKISSDFMKEITKKIWYADLDKIKQNFNKEYNKLPKAAKKKYLEIFQIKFTYNTNKIEGSTLTLKETARLIEEGIAPRNKPIKDVKETESHKLVFESMIGEKKDLSLNLILSWHYMLFENSDIEIAGKIRNHNVAIAGSKFEPPMYMELDFLLRDFFKWYNNNKKNIHPVELSALAHLKFVTIHPFTDGNGRLSRLIMNFILNRNNFPMLDISYTNRNSYYNALEKSQTKYLDRPFVMYLVKRYLKVYKKYIS